jgi:AcrR family transcriptional regulator
VRLISQLQPVTMLQLPGVIQRLKLMAAGERAIALAGIEGIALETVAKEAGNRNKNAIQYHFGSKLNFVEEIISTRRREMNRRRNELLVGAMASGMPIDLEILIEAMHAPLAEQVGLEGEHFFAKILLQLLARSGQWAALPAWIGIEDPDNPTVRIWEMIARAMPSGEPFMKKLRLAAVAKIIPTFIVEWDYSRAQGGSLSCLEEVLEEGIVVCTASLSASGG